MNRTKDILIREANGDHLGDKIAPITAMNDKLLMAQSLHQFDKDPASSRRIEALLMRRLRVTIAGNGWNDQFVGQAISVGLSEQGHRFDILQEASRPAMTGQKWDDLLS